MKLLLVIDSLGSGGAQRQMVTLAAGLVRRGHQVELFAYYDEDHFADLAVQAGVVLHVYPKSSRFSIRPLFLLRSLINSGGFDGILAFLETPSVYAEIARFGRSGPPLIVSERSTYASGSLGWQGYIKQQMHRLADGITVNSYHQRDTMTRMFPWMESRISVIWNGVDTENFCATPLPSPVDGVLRVQVLASVAQKKNPLGLARAMVMCREKFDLRVEVNWAGVSMVSGEGDSAKTETSAFLHESGVADQWSWAGKVTDVRPLLAGCDAVIHPSLAEGLPNALCEAMSCGRPILASDIGDHARLVATDANGFLFNPREHSAIANALNRYAKLSSFDRRRMGEAARHFAEAQLSTERFVRAYESRFMSLLKDRKGA